MEQLPTRVIQGQETARGRYPWMASVLIRGTNGSMAACGGSLINDRFILTAAHCVSGARTDDLRVTLLAHTSQERKRLPPLAVQDIIVHSGWTGADDGLKHDLALLRLQQPRNLSATQTHVCLPDAAAGDTSKSNMGSAFVTGWGLMDKPLSLSKHKADALREAATRILPSQACEMRFGSKYDRQLQWCAGTGACQGDSGGPLAVRVKGIVEQVGIVSFGPATCNIGLFLAPTVYTRVDAHLTFIREHTQEAVSCPRHSD